VTTKEQVIERIRAKTAPLVRNNYDVTQPIELGVVTHLMNETSAHVVSYVRP
jgi:hypothetical protein